MLADNKAAKDLPKYNREQDTLTKWHMCTSRATFVNMTAPPRYTSHSDDVLAQLYPPKEPRAFLAAASFIRYSPYGLQPRAVVKGPHGWSVTNGKHASPLSWTQLVQYMSQGLPADRIQDTYNSWHKLTDSATQPPFGQEPPPRPAVFTVGRFQRSPLDNYLAQRHGELWTVTGIHKPTGFTWPALVEFMGADSYTWRILK